MEYTEDRIENEIIFLPSLLKMFQMFQMNCWYNNGHDYQNKVEHIAKMCNNCGKETGLSMKSKNT